MIKLQGHLPDAFYVAVSGGPDSMAALDFLRKGPTDPFAVFCHHNTEASDKGYEIVNEYCKEYNVPCTCFFVCKDSKPLKMSQEEYWRNERYKCFTALRLPVITAHHLDDCVEEYMINTLKRGRLGVIPYRNQNVFRPFRLTSKSDFITWCVNKDVPFIIDDSNINNAFLRPNIRDLRVEVESFINLGLTKMVRKMILKDDQNDYNMPSCILCL